MYEKALEFQSRGVSVIPIEKGGKKPLIQWKPFADKAADEKQIEEWFLNKDVNIAMVCGKVSNYTVIDLDKEDDTDLLEYAKKLGFPETITIKTPGGGFHLYYEYNPNWKTGVRTFDYVDVRNDNSYVLLPPSGNKEGVKYEILKQCSPAKLPDDLNQKRWYEKDDNKWDEVIKGVEKGSRNDTAAKMAGLYLRKLNPQEAWQALSVWNQSNNPPLPEYELKNTFNSINKREQVQKKTREPGDIDISEMEQNYKLVTFSELLDRSDRELEATKAEECVSFGYDWLDYKITGLFPGELMVIGGETGCLHPDTEIYDPTDGSRHTVKQREQMGKEFNVFSLHKDKVIVTKAEAPRKFTKVPMYELSNGEKKITVTGKHRVFDGEKYTTVHELQESSSCLLPTIEEPCLLESSQDVPCWKQKVLDYQFGYRFSYRSDGGLLQRFLNIFRAFSPSQDDAHEHIRYCYNKGVEACEEGHIHPYPPSSPLPRKDLNYLENSGKEDESVFQIATGTSSQTFQRQTSSYKFDSCSCLSRINKYIQKSFFRPKVCNASLNLKFSSSSKHIKWEVKQKQDEYYYDFTVPKYKNYYCNGLFHHNTGKTTFATKIVYKAALNQGVKSCILALEDRLNDYGIKSIYFEIGRLRKTNGLRQYPWNEYRRNNIDDEDYQQYKKEAIANLRTDKIHFVEVQEMMSIELLEVILDTLTAQGFELFLIDHLHYFDLLKGDNNKSDYVEKVMVRMKQNQNRNGARIILIAHYRKLNGQKPSDGAFKDSMAIAQNANYTMHLWRDKKVEGGETEIFISKSRNPNGEAHISVVYDVETNEYSLGDYDSMDAAWDKGSGDGEVEQKKLINELPK